MTKPVIVFQHVAHEGLGTIERFFRQAGVGWQVVPLYEHVPETPDWNRTAGLVVMGGPMNVDQVDRYRFLACEPQWIAQAVHRQLPVLGVCLGAQLLAKALGAPVRVNAVKEIGWYSIQLTDAARDDPLFAGLDRVQTVFQWHGDTFDLPAGAVLLATSKLCRNQAFRFGRSAWALQFHVEMTAEMVSDWLAIPENRAELAGLKYIDAEQIGADTARQLPAMQQLGTTLLSRFAAACKQRAT